MPRARRGASVDSLIGVAVSCFIAAFAILVCTIIEQVGAIERYSIKARLAGLVMNLMQVPLSLALAWPISSFWQSLGIGSFITVPLWTLLAPLGAAGYALQFLTVAMLT